MGIAAVTNDYLKASEIALQCWVGCFGEGVSLDSLLCLEVKNKLMEKQVLGIALTDTFGTPAFLEAFKKPIRPFDTAERCGPENLVSAAACTTSHTTNPPGTSNTPTHGPSEVNQKNIVSRVESEKRPRTYAEVFTGVRQDSGDPAEFVRMMRQFYDSIGVKVRWWHRMVARR